MVKRGSPLGGHHVGQGGLARFIMGMGIMGLPVGISSGDQLAHGARLRKDLISVMLWAGRTAQDAGVYGWVQDETLKARSSQRCHASFVSRRSWAHWSVHSDEKGFGCFQATVADGCGRLRTVADVNATSSEHTFSPQTPRVKREPLLRIREKEKNISKGKEKERREWFWKKNTSKKKLDTIEDHRKKTYYWGSGLLMDYPLEKWLDAVFFFNWVLIRHQIFWEIGHFWEFQMKLRK